MANKEKARELFRMYEGFEEKDDGTLQVDKTDDFDKPSEDGTYKKRFAGEASLAYRRGHAITEVFYVPEGCYKVKAKVMFKWSHDLNFVEWNVICNGKENTAGHGRFRKETDGLVVYETERSGTTNVTDGILEVDLVWMPRTPYDSKETSIEWVEFSCRRVP